MRLSLLLFMMGVFFITAGYMNQLDDGCKK